MLISLTDIRKTYRMGEVEIEVLRGITETVGKGEFVAIMGSSGSGKTTLMNIMGCMDKPSSGGYILDGLDITKLDESDLADVRNAKIGFVFQSFNLLSRTSALDNVQMPLIYGPSISNREKHDRAEALLERVGLKDRIHHHPGQLSGGEQQRVAIARSLINHPALLLADEPTGNLDSKSSAEIMRIFAELHHDDITIVMVTHEEDIAAHASRVIYVRDGLVIQGRQKHGAGGVA